MLEQFFLALFQLALFVLKSLADSFRRGEGSFLALALALFYSKSSVINDFRQFYFEIRA